MDLIKVVNEAFATKKEFPAFKSGDTITVAYRIKEGNKERIQQYRGVVIRISGHGDKKRFTVRKVKYAVLNCITCVLLQVRKQESKKEDSNPFGFNCHTKKPSDLFRVAFLLFMRFVCQKDVSPMFLSVSSIEILHIKGDRYLYVL